MTEQEKKDLAEMVGIVVREALRREDQTFKLWGISINSLLQALLIAGTIGLYNKVSSNLENDIIQKEQINTIQKSVEGIKVNVNKMATDIQEIAKDQERLKVHHEKD